MGSEWPRVQLGDIAEIIDSRHKTPQYTEFGYPMVRVVDVNGGALKLDGTKKVAKEVYEDFSKGRDPEPGDLVISRVGSYGNVSYVTSDEKFCLGQNTALIVPRDNSRFIYYQLVSPMVKAQIDEMVVGAVQKTISLKSIRSLQLYRPLKSEQIAISNILGTLDDKIELNRQINTTLEAMAQALFKSWFVDFDPVIDNALAAGNPIPPELAARAERRQQHHTRANTSADAKTTPYQPLPADIQQQFPDRFVFTEAMGWVPEGWEVSTIGDQIETTGGGTPSTKDESFWEGGVHAFCTPKDMSQLTSWVLMDTERYLTDAGVNKVSSGQLPVGTVLMSSRAPIGYLAISDIPVSVNQGIIAMLPNSTFGPLYLLNWTKFNMGQITDRANGSTFLEISKKNFRPIPFLAPSDLIAQRFNEETKAIYSKILLLSEQISNLTKLRDSLLPKLLSGQLRLPDAEAAVDKALAEA